MSSAYVIADTLANNATSLDQYRRLAHPSVVKFGGQYLVGGGPFETLMGAWTPHRLAMVRFENMEVARRWWNSSEYSDARAIRAGFAASNIVLVEGV